LNEKEIPATKACAIGKKETQTAQTFKRLKSEDIPWPPRKLVNHDGSLNTIELVWRECFDRPKRHPNGYCSTLTEMSGICHHNNTWYHSFFNLDDSIPDNHHCWQRYHTI